MNSRSFEKQFRLQEFVETCHRNNQDEKEKEKKSDYLCRRVAAIYTEGDGLVGKKELAMYRQKYNALEPSDLVG